MHKEIKNPPRKVSLDFAALNSLSPIDNFDEASFFFFDGDVNGFILRNPFSEVSHCQLWVYIFVVRITQFATLNVRLDYRLIITNAFNIYNFVLLRRRISFCEEVLNKFPAL